jgi:hypothetical protein
MAIAVTNFPGALDNNTTLVAAANSVSTTLSGSHDDSVTTINVVSATTFPASGIAKIDSELLSYTGKTATSLTGVTRGFESTAAAAHTSGAAVSFVFTAQMWQSMINAVIAAETKLGSGADTPTDGQVLIGNTTAGTSQWRNATKSDVGLDNVDNTADADKPISSDTLAALADKADIDSPALVGDPTAPTKSADTNTTAIATTAFVKNAIDVVKGGVSASFDTLNELATEVTAKVPNTRTVNGQALSSDVVITDALLSVSDVTTNNATTSQHGFLKKLSGSASDFLNGEGNFAVPAGSGDMVLASAQSVSAAKTFADGTLVLAHASGSLPAVVAGAFLLLSDGRLYLGAPDGSSWMEIFVAPNSGPVSVALGGTGVTTLSGILKGNGTSPVTTATESIGLAVSDETTTITTGTAKLTFRMPHAFTLTGVRANVNTVSSSGAVQVDINEGGASILSTKLTIDESEKTSTTAATAAVISDSALADDAEITIDIDSAGTGAKGLKVWLLGHQ